MSLHISYSPTVVELFNPSQELIDQLSARVSCLYSNNTLIIPTDQYNSLNLSSEFIESQCDTTLINNLSLAVINTLVDFLTIEVAHNQYEGLEITDKRYYDVVVHVLSQKLKSESFANEVIETLSEQTLGNF